MCLCVCTFDRSRSTNRKYAPCCALLPQTGMRHCASPIAVTMPLGAGNSVAESLSVRIPALESSLREASFRGRISNIWAVKSADIAAAIVAELAKKFDAASEARARLLGALADKLSTVARGRDRASACKAANAVSACAWATALQAVQADDADAPLMRARQCSLRTAFKVSFQACSAFCSIQCSRAATAALRYVFVHEILGVPDFTPLRPPLLCCKSSPGWLAKSQPGLHSARAYICKSSLLAGPGAQQSR